MKRPLDPQYASLILNLLTRPFDHTKAYDLGIVNGEGMLIKRPESQSEKDAYTPLHQLAFGIKRILDAFPGAENKVKQLSVAMNFVRKQHVPEQFKESFDPNQFLKEMLLVLEHNICLAEEEVLVELYLKEDGEAAPVAGTPPTNNTDGVDIHTPVITKLFRRKKVEDGNATG